MDTEVPTQDATSAITPTEIQELIVVKIKRSSHGMIANEIPSLIDEALDHTFQSAIMSAQGGICTVMYKVVEQVLLTSSVKMY